MPIERCTPAEPQLYEYSRSRLRDKIGEAINGVSAENGSNTPDFILAQYLIACLAALDEAVLAREDWYGHRHAPGSQIPAPSPEAS